MRYNKTKRIFRQFAINDNDVSAGKSNRKCHSIYLCRYSLRFGNLRRGNRSLKSTLNETTSCKSIISHIPVTRSDLKQERSFFLGSVSIFLQLVVASCNRAQSLYTKQRFSERFTEEHNGLFKGFNNYR